MSMAQVKPELRTQILKQLQQCSWFFAAWNDSLRIHLLHFLNAQKGLWAGFLPLANEPQIESLLRTPELSHLTWSYPVVKGPILEFWVPGPEGFGKGPKGNLEPLSQGSRQLKLSELSGVLVPALAYDLQGRRLGRGGGFFDQTLNSFSGKKVGVAFGPQIYSQVPSESHDIQMDSVVTDQGILQFSKVRSI